MSLTSFLQRVVQILEGSGVPYMLTGSLAAAYYATPRATQDIDVVIDTEEEGIERLVQGFSDADFYVDREAALAAWHTHGQFNAIDPDSGWKVDLIVRKDRSFSRTEFERREPADLLGIEVSLASLEDVVIAKLEWAKRGDSELQRTDIVRLLELSGDSARSSLPGKVGGRAWTPEGMELDDQEVGVRVPGFLREGGTVSRCRRGRSPRGRARGHRRGRRERSAT